MPIINLIMHYETKAATSSFLIGALIPHWKNNPLHYNISQIIVLHPASHILNAPAALLTPKRKANGSNPLRNIKNVW